MNNHNLIDPSTINNLVDPMHQLTIEEKKRLKNKRKKMNRKIRKRYEGSRVREESRVIDLDSFPPEDDNHNQTMTNTEFEFSNKIDFSKLNPNMGMNRAALELFEFNIFEEYDALKQFVKANGTKDMYKIARMKIFEYILNCVKSDPMDGETESCEKNIQLLKDAGKMLYESEGMDGMYDDLLWSFIPDRYHRSIDMAWDGIGLWQG